MSKANPTNDIAILRLEISSSLTQLRDLIAAGVSDTERVLLSGLIDHLIAAATQLVNTELEKRNAEIERLTGKITTNKNMLESAHKKLKNLISAMEKVGKIAEALGNLIGAAAKK